MTDSHCVVESFHSGITIQFILMIIQIFVRVIKYLITESITRFHSCFLNNVRLIPPHSCLCRSPEEKEIFERTFAQQNCCQTKPRSKLFSWKLVEFVVRRRDIKELRNKLSIHEKRWSSRLHYSLFFTNSGTNMGRVSRNGKKTPEPTNNSGGKSWFQKFDFEWFCFFKFQHRSYQHQ